MQHCIDHLGSNSGLTLLILPIATTSHNIWLRDHCRCPECFHPKTKQRLLDTFAIPADIQPESVESTTEGLLVHWQPDGHTSLYPWRWLMDNSYAPPIEPHKPSDKVLWGKGIGSSPPTVRYEEVMASDEGVLKWLTKIVSTEAPRLFPLFST